jgi:multiple sugar transport system substrate-binding protein
MCDDSLFVRSILKEEYKMKRLMSLGMLAVLLVPIVAACAPAAAPTAPPPVQVIVTQPPVVQTVVVPQTVVAQQTVVVPATAVPVGTQFKGITVNVLTFTGPQIAEPLQRRAPDFERLTGAKINVIVVPFSDLYQKILTDNAMGTNSYDAYVLSPQWMADFVGAGALEDLTDRINADKDLQWDDVAPFFRNFSATYQGKLYTVPLDGDFQMVYYRKDILTKDGVKPPETWDDYLAIAKQYQGKPLAPGGKPIYGSCISKKRAAQGFQMFWSIVGPYLQSQGTKEGAFFDTTSMKPLVMNDGMARALDIYKESTQYGPPDELNLDVGDTRSLFDTGRCVLSLDWGDIGTLSVDPANAVPDVINNVGSIIDPGTKQVVDPTNRVTGKLVDCDSTTCPNAVNGVNHAPYAAFGGWSAAINKNAKPDVKNAAYAFFSYMSQPAQSSVDVTIGRTGFNPYRLSHFANLGPWLHSGMNQAMAQDYLGAIQASLQSPNMILDMRVPQTQYYQQVALDQALAQFLAGEITRDQAMKQINDAWESKTNELGRDKQLAAYLGSLSITK